jgi:hypothetical protein
MISLAKLLRIKQGFEKKYKNIGLENFGCLLETKTKTRSKSHCVVRKFSMAQTFKSLSFE